MHTRHILSIAFYMFAIVATAQTTAGAVSPADQPDCKALSLDAANEIAAGLTVQDMERVELAIADVTRSCGMSEVTIRTKILSKIMTGQSAVDDIRMYFEEEYYDRTYYRITAARAADFGYSYLNRESQFGFVPLRHQVDSIAAKISRDLMETNDLSKDERLLCALFSGDIEKFNKDWEGKENRDSYAAEYRRNSQRNWGREKGALVFYSGIYVPLGSRNIIGTNPMFGFSFSSPVERKVSAELAIKVRIHHNDQPFQYYAMGKVNEADSDVGLFGGLVVGVKLYDRKKLLVQSRFGVGIESVDTGLWEPASTKANASDPNNRNYFDLETVHTFAGIAVMTPVAYSRHIGVGINLHACPYGLDKNLKTPMDNFAASGELFFRF
ncbi:MAG TPA: hypothetical protein VK508_03485 [Cyclobacteriaceae bacterium]|nr:hypothetical protein [Cyclobacteriaceae bacterium]